MKFRVMLDENAKMLVESRKWLRRTIMIDLMELRKEIKKGVLIPFVKRDKVYIKDAENEETIMICDLKEMVAE